MTDEEETNLKAWLAGLANGFSQLQDGMKLMTDVVVKLERRVADLENSAKSKSNIIIPKANFGELKDGKTH